MDDETRPPTAPGTIPPVGTPTADAPGKGAKPPPDMASLMMELARIRRDVEGQAERGKPLGAKGWALALVLAASLVWAFLGGPCRPPAGLP